MTSLRDGDYMTYLIKYIEKNTSKGVKEDNIQIMLEKQGYSRPAIKRAFSLYKEKHPVKTVEEVKEEPKVEIAPEEPKEEKKGFFSFLSGIFKKKKEEKAEEKVSVNEEGDVVDI